MKEAFIGRCILVILFVGVAGAVLAPLYKANVEDTILDHYIVVFEDGSEVYECIDAIVKHPLFEANGGEVVLTYTHAIGGFAGVLPGLVLNWVRSFPFVKYVQEEQVIYADDVASWGLDRIDDRNLTEDNDFKPRGNGTGVNVYVLDSGINPYHEDFSGRAFTNASIDFCKENTGGIDCYGHGTHCAGIAGGTTYGVASKVSLHAVRVLGCSGGGAVGRTISGIDWVAANHTKPAVASMSLGSQPNQATDDAVVGLYNAGVPVVCSAGNNKENVTNHSPARVDEAITVGALNKNNSRAGFSNFGELVDIFAPGVKIVSDWDEPFNNATKTKSGTSMAAPHVTGAVAILLEENPTLDPAGVTQKLIDESSKNVIVGDPLSPNRAVYVGSLDSSNES